MVVLIIAHDTNIKINREKRTSSLQLARRKVLNASVVLIRTPLVAVRDLKRVINKSPNGICKSICGLRFLLPFCMIVCVKVQGSGVPKGGS